MRWFIGCLLALAMVSAAFAGQDPYIAVVGNDIDANGFYLSEKYEQFLYDQAFIGVPVCWGSNPSVTPQTRVGGTGCEQFRSNTPMNQPEICDASGTKNAFGDYTFFGEPNAKIAKQNAGYFEWWIRLPKKPDGEINIVIQCGVLKPNTFAAYDFEAVLLCAAETGERIGTGFCTRDDVEPGQNPIQAGALPVITARAYPGPYAITQWQPFHLTAYKNPGSYVLSTSSEAMTNSASLQVLDGTAGAKVLLKSCMDKAVLVKIPVTGQYNAKGEMEQDLEAGDLISVRLDVPRSNTVDIYCHSQSVRLMGIGEAPW